MTLVSARPSSGELSTRPGSHSAASSTPGLFPLDQLSGGPALLYVPESIINPAPLVTMLHGAGGQPRHSVDLVQAHADRLGFILLAPASAASTWDVIARRRYGADVASIDDLLGRVFGAHAIDPARVAVAGFSDGASYALSLGLTNGDLFSRIFAFSPGFMAPARTQGTPSIYISHGVNDEVLPIDPCSRRIEAQLRGAGYEIDYREFPDGHIVPDAIAAAFFATLSEGKSA